MNDSSRNSNYLYIGLCIIIVLVLFIGWNTGRKAVRFSPSSGNNWSKLSLILDQIDANYVDPVNSEQITEKAIPFILSELDPHSVYLPPKEREYAEQSLAANFFGIGIQFNVPNDTAIVIQVIPGGPSERAGLLAGDRIVEVDGLNVAGVNIPQDSLVNLMRGPLDTTVKIGVKRGGVDGLVEFDITRGVIPVKSVDVAYMINDTTAYVKLSKFSRSSYIEFMSSMLDLDTAKIERIIFDLRDNSGGYLDQAYLLANEFLEKDDLIVYMEGVHRRREDLKATGSGIFQNTALAVLINENSASSSEIFAGAMQDNDRAVVYGRRSFGKGLVQEPINFSDGSGLRLTVARFYTPSGRCIQKHYESGEVLEYGTDIIERYVHGEMTTADSIKKNDSLKYYTVGGRTVYGGGGIIPDVFVPLDTISDNDFLVNVNRNSYQVKFSMQFADRHRNKLQQATSLDELNDLLDSFNLMDEFREYLLSNGVKIDKRGWNKSEDVLNVQIRAMVARYSKLDDNAFYPIIAEIDNVVNKALEDPCSITVGK